MRIQKFLANYGIGSRRQVEEWVSLGEISVNEKPATLGQKVSVEDKIRFRGKLLRFDIVPESETRVLLYHKPEGQICSRVSLEGKETVFTSLPPLKNGRWVMVGRLDVNTSGLLLFTNSGELAHRLMHPSFGLERQYLARVIGRVNENTLAQLTKGVKLEEGFCRFHSVTPTHSKSGINQWYHCTLKEGKYREVRQLWASQDCQVSRLIRIQYGPIALPRDLYKGRWQELPQDQVSALASNVAPTPVAV
jgi:23S rRNA pseudouridine2605 synthase